MRVWLGEPSLTTKNIYTCMINAHENAYLHERNDGRGITNMVILMLILVFNASYRTD